MLVQEFDDRQVCHDLGPCSYFVEQWSWKFTEDGRSERDLMCATYLLSGCDVREALRWADENQADPGTFVLHAATSTSRGYLVTAWLTGESPGENKVGESMSVRIER